MKLRHWLISGILLAIVFMALTVLLVGSKLSAPMRQAVVVPAELSAEAVTFTSESGSLIHGSWIQGKPGKSGIILMHGIRADRRALFARAKFFRDLGYHVLLFDFQAHGESPGNHITFGYLESRDAHAAVAFARLRVPRAKWGAIGISLGGASALLGERPIEVDALVLESVYADIETAIDHRLHMRLGIAAEVVAPFLIAQIPYRLGIPLAELKPVERIGKIRCPLLLLGGTEDLHATRGDTEALFAAAPEPKQLEWFQGAHHVDLMSYEPAKYRDLVSEFMAARLAK